MIRKLLAAALIAALLALGTGVPAEAAPSRPDPTSYESIASWYKCGEFKKGQHVGGYLYRGRGFYVHTRTLQPTSHPYATCTR